MFDEELTGRVINCFYKVYNTLGYGFIEGLYHNAMIIEMVQSGLAIEVKKPICVYYGSHLLGNFEADLVVERRVIVELKATEKVHPAHEAQLTNYLRATDIEIGLLLNFGRCAEIKRKLFENAYKRRTSPQVDDGIISRLISNVPPESV